MSHAAPPALVEVVRDSVVESVHRGHVAVVTAAGATLGGVGRPDVEIYPRSAIKPLQGLVTRAWLQRCGVELDEASLAIACASHEGAVDQQVEAARLLALGGVDETALRCPRDRPSDPRALDDDPRPTQLAHNCSGKHAGFVAAQVVGGEPAERYLDPDSALQVAVAGQLAEVCGVAPQGPGVDGCGAPAWRVPLDALAGAFARLAEGRGALGAVRDAMQSRPELVGGNAAVDTALMRALPGLVAKRGAEGVLACGVLTAHGPVGVAVKITDGARRGSGPAVAAALARLGFAVPGLVARPLVLGGGEPHGELRPAGALDDLALVI